MTTRDPASLYRRRDPGAMGAAVLAAAVLAAVSLSAQSAGWTPLRFEAEACSEPADAWLRDRLVPGKWNLWSTDLGAAERWSGGVVLQAAPVEADRATPEEGAPPLHSVLRDVPAGIYDVEVKVARTVAVSLDGTSWQRFTGGFLERRVRIEGSYELWVDDRYAHVPPGPCYYDAVILHPVPPLENGLYNPGFELGPGDQLVGWQFSPARGAAVATLDGPGRAGRGRSLHIQDTAPLDPFYGGYTWSLRNTASLPVQAGQSAVVRAWVQAARNPQLTVAVEGWSNGQRRFRQVGSTHASGPCPWQERVAGFIVPESVDALAVVVQGKTATDLCLDDLSLTLEAAPSETRPRVSGWAHRRVVERLDRGLVAVPSGDGVYLSWRLLPTDPADAEFDIYRRVAGGNPERLNSSPVVRTTDFLDPAPVPGDQAVYTVRLRRALRPDPESRPALWGDTERGLGYVRIPLAEAVQPSKAAVGDLDGDGRYEVVIKYPGHDVWCWNEAGPGRWERSRDTYKIEAYTATGERLWHRDLGWGIEQGLWYSPYLVYDFDGDGRAEVAVKTADGDPREADGRVLNGPEWVAIWDGRSGEETARAPWPDRLGFESYDHVCRHFLSVAYLDGRTPCLLVQRGNYGRVIVDAYQYHGARLQRLWRHDNQDYGGIWWGQGAHTTQVGDLDGDGRDEVVLGSNALDDTGAPLWSIGKGHPDYVFLGDIDPAHPGWEVFLGLEPPQEHGGNICVDAATGRTLWELAVPTNHVGIAGMCADIDPRSPGLESQAVDVDKDKKASHGWLWSADGHVLQESDRPIGTSWTAWWDADLQRELVRGVVADFDGSPLGERLTGSVLLVADLFGDWREEILCASAGELRIYTTDIPASDRRVTLAADPLYRNGMALYGMGYPQVPLTSACLEAASPGLNLTVRPDDTGAATCRVVIAAAHSAPLQGRLALSAAPGHATPAGVAVDLAAGERQTVEVGLTDLPPGTSQVVFSARLEAGSLLLTGQAAAVDRRPRLGVALVEAEEFAAQGGGEVHTRDAKDKPGVHAGRCFSHWFTAGHWLEWRIAAPKGRYPLALRYCAGADATRSLTVAGQVLPPQRFRATGGFGQSVEEWDTHVVSDAQGAPLWIETDGAAIVVRLVAPGGDAGVNLDYLTLLPAP